MADKIRVLVADAAEAQRHELCELIQAQKDMQVVGLAADGDAVLRLAGETDPAVALIDLSLPGGGLWVLERLTETYQALRIVVLAIEEDVSLLRSVLAFGSLGFVVHRKDYGLLLSTIRKFKSGRGYVDVPTGGLNLDPGLQPGPERRRELEERLDSLSRREREVLGAVAFGYTNREIGERLGVSVKSIETYRYRLAEKLEFRSRADLVRFALEVGLLRHDRPGLPPES